MALVKKSIKAYIWNQALKISEFFLILIFSIIIARFLSANEFGIYSVLMSICAFIFLITNLGFDEALNTFVPKLENLNKNFLIKKIFYLRIIILFIISVLIFFCSPILVKIFKIDSIDTYVRLLIFYIIFESLTSLFIHSLLGEFKTKIIFTGKILKRFFIIIFTLIVFTYNKSLFSIINILNIFAVLFFLYFFIFYRKIILQKITNNFNLKKIYKFGITVWFTNIINFLLGKQLDIILLSYFLINTAVIGYYNIAFGLSIIISSFFLSGLEGVGLSFFSQLNKKNPDKLKYAYSINYNYAFIASVPFLMFALFFSKNIIEILYSSKYASASILLQIFIIFIIANRIFGGGGNITLFYAINKEKIAFKLRTIAGLLNLILNIILIPFLGVIGAVIGTGISNFLMIVIEYRIAQKFIKIKLPLKFVLKIILSGFIISFIMLKIFPVHNIIMLIIGVIIYSLLNIVLLYFLKPLEKPDYDFLMEVNGDFFKHLIYFVNK